MELPQGVQLDEQCARAHKRAAAQAEERATKGPAGYREVGCATVSYYDRDRQRLPRCARMPQANKATLKKALSAQAALGQRPDLRLVKLAEAASDNCT